MKTRFVCKIPDARLVRNAIDRKEGRVHEYIIERTIYLSKEKFIHFRSHLLDDNDELINYKNEMYIDKNKVWHVLMFCSMIADIMILVYSDGEEHAKYVSIISNGGKKIEPRFTTSKRYTRKRENKSRRTTSTK